MCYFFFFNDTATTEIYTLSLHDALPISRLAVSRLPPLWESHHLSRALRWALQSWSGLELVSPWAMGSERSEEHTSELQSRQYLVCRLLLEKKKKLKWKRLNIIKSTISYL